MKSKKVFVLLFPAFLVVIAILIAIAPSKYVVPVIMYHNIDYKKDSALSVTPENFERQMRFLKSFGYNVISIDELAGLLKDKKPLKPKTIAITFDDGFENNYSSAYPVLKKYKLPATIFVIVNEIGKEGYLTWSELREMSENNIVIGSHTLTHAYLTSLDPETLDRELVLSKSILEEKLNRKVNVMSYPLGGFNEKVKEAVKKAGYTGACATSPGKKYPNNDLYAIKRLRISRQCDNLFVFWIETSGFYTWIKEHRDDD